ncbi:TadA family conjugal transfer-associated ATPase [Microbacterium sp. LMI1-1-1.1]|uniref:TadA family conjugal transfer-associated ATPase n=1 Tax=Microbacterium sp. LMI1-1-1.1 TaxID=3135223 RepID=UPI0034653DCA
MPLPTSPPQPPGGDSRSLVREDLRSADAWRDPALAFLRPFLDDDAVTDVFVNGEAGLFVDHGDGPQRIPGWWAPEADVRRLAVRLIAMGDRHLDDASPCVDVRLPDGIRVHAVLAPIATSGTAISIRVARWAAPDLDRLQRTGMFDAVGRARLEGLVEGRANVLVTGATGAGKTTLLSALLGRVPARERLITIEEVAELRPRHPHHVALEARQPNLEGAGGIDLARLVREALRMRPDRLVVGECRGPEIRDLLMALNTGHDGGAGTLHASGLGEVPARLEALGALAGMDATATARQVASAITCVIHVERGPRGRRIAGVGRPVVRDGRLEIAGESW